MRPTILNPLFAEITALAGVGPKIAGLIGRVAGTRIVDLLLTAPVNMIDRSARPKIMKAPLGAVVTIEVNVDRVHLVTSIRNFMHAFFAPWPGLAGPLFTAAHATVVERYAMGRKAMDSIYSGGGTFWWSGFLARCQGSSQLVQIRAVLLDEGFPDDFPQYSVALNGLS